MHCSRTGYWKIDSAHHPNAAGVRVAAPNSGGKLSSISRKIHPSEGEIDANAAGLLGLGYLMLPLFLHPRVHDEKAAVPEFDCLHGAIAHANLKTANCSETE